MNYVRMLQVRMRKQQREITNNQREISNNAINDVKQISPSHVITSIIGNKLLMLR